MQQFKLNIINRDNTGRGVARRLRAEGNIPACVYSKGNSRSISLSVVEFRELNRSLAGGAALIELVDEKGATALTHIQEVQRNAVKNTITHIDFHEVARGELFVAHVPVQFVGEADALGVKNESGVLDHQMHELEIRCMPANLPDHIVADVHNLSVGDAFHVSDLPAIEGVEYLDDAERVIVTCRPPTVATAAEDAADAELASAASAASAAAAEA